MPPEANTTPDTPQPISESPSPVIESPASPAPTTESPTPPQEASPATTALETPPAPVEEVPASETVQPSTQTGQTEGNEPLAPKPDPIPPPSAAASQAQPIIIPPTGNFIRNLLAKAGAKIQSKKKAKLEKILQALTKKTKITNDEVEKLLHVSDATAERYLAILVKEGKIKQDRKTGAGVAYTKI